MKKIKALQAFKFFSVISPLVALTASALVLHSCGKSNGGNEFDFEDVSRVKNSPYPNFRGGDVSGERNFATLINKFAQGRATKTPWAGYWWPYKENGIASARSGSGGSPAGKYDAARGGQTSSQSWESRFHGPNVKGIQGWWGHCNGWCAAAALYDEPHETSTVNGIAFGIADIKGLLSEAGMSASADFYGNRMDWASDYGTPKQDDTVPAQYFLVLTNHMGNLGHTVLIDRFTGTQVWNQPLAGYRFEYPKPEDYLGADPSAPGVYRINLTSTMWWMSDEVAADIQTPEFDFPATDSNVIAQRTLKMELWLDAPVEFGPDGKITKSGNVIVTRKDQYFFGGAWKMGGYSDDAWPDYMWVPYSLVPSSDPDDDNANSQIDIRWIENHILPPGGKDDPSARPRPVEPAPSIRPSASPNPSASETPTSTPPPTYTPRPTPTSTLPFPFPTSNPQPTSEPTLAPTSAPTFAPTGMPTGGPGGFPTQAPTFEPRPTAAPLPLPQR